ncbi:transposase [Eubacteriales bacterium OttesenSCG-928-N14]|nr:transposase [Eubacteriales bacterium OttesenSCG-928-N14]
MIHNLMPSLGKPLGPTKLCLTAKMKIEPDTKARKELLKVMRVYRNACNYTSKFAFRYQQTSPLVLHRYLYEDIRERFGLRSQMTESVFRTVAAAYKAMDTKDEWSKPAEYKKPFAAWVYDRDYKINGDTVVLSTLKSNVDVALITKGMREYLIDGWKFGTSRINISGSEWYLEVPVTKEAPALHFDETNCVVGCDLGLNFLVTAYDSNGMTTFFSGREIKHKRQHYFNLRTELSQKGTASAKMRLHSISNREYRFMQDVNHTVAKHLVESYPPGTAFVLEDLKNIAPKLKENFGSSFHALSNWPFADLRQKIEYKALKHGSRVITVDPKYTSQTCPRCGYSHKENRNSRQHILKCKRCGYSSNDDRVAAMNILHRGLQQLQALQAEHA